MRHNEKRRCHSVLHAFCTRNLWCLVFETSFLIFFYLKKIKINVLSRYQRWFKKKKVRLSVRFMFAPLQGRLFPLGHRLVEIVLLGGRVFISRQAKLVAVFFLCVDSGWKSRLVQCCFGVVWVAARGRPSVRSGKEPLMRRRRRCREMTPIIVIAGSRVVF